MAGHYADGPHAGGQADHDFSAGRRNQVAPGVRHEVNQAGDWLDLGRGANVRRQLESADGAAAWAVNVEHDVFDHRVSDSLI
ncbi:hypothetical protein D3C80_2094190 [compost metagenome]